MPQYEQSAISSSGRVLQCEVADGAIADAAVRAELMKIITAWRFEKIDKVGDITEVVIPLVFTM